MEEHKTEIAYWAGRLLGYDQSWEVAEEIVEAIKEAQQQALILPVVVKSFYCGGHNKIKCEEQCYGCEDDEKLG